MKNWTRPEVSELEVSMTASGCWDTECELWPFVNDSKKEQDKSRES
ncbi:MAG: hypothetical protein MR966_00780 [Lachnospiraceae bacterium]|nr:hypothetical protein [Lachnospiraceae bacterium]